MPNKYLIIVVFQIFVILRSIEILIESYFWLGVYMLFASGNETSGAARRQNVTLSPTIVYIELNGKLTFFLLYLLFPLSKKGTQRHR